MPKQKTADEKIMDTVNALHPDSKAPHDPVLERKRRQAWQIEAMKHAPWNKPKQ